MLRFVVSGKAKGNKRWSKVTRVTVVRNKTFFCRGGAIFPLNLQSRRPFSVLFQYFSLSQIVVASAPTLPEIATAANKPGLSAFVHHTEGIARRGFSREIIKHLKLYISLYIVVCF